LKKNQKPNEILGKSIDNHDLPFDFFKNRMKSCPSHQLAASLPRRTASFPDARRRCCCRWGQNLEKRFQTPNKIFNKPIEIFNKLIKIFEKSNGIKLEFAVAAAVPGPRMREQRNRRAGARMHTILW
jgi:hypothetical protein